MKKLNFIKYNSPVVLTFSLVSLLVLILGYITKGQSNFYLFSVYRSNLLDPLFYIRLFTHVLGHINISHYTNNMLLILLVGPMLEEKYGSKKLLYIILLVALITGLVHILLSKTILLGASGVAFAFILLTSITGEKNGIPLTLIIVAIIYIGDQVFVGLSTSDSISQIAHIIGGITGALIGLYLRKEPQNLN